MRRHIGYGASRLTEDGRQRIIEAQHRRKGQPWNKRTQEQRFAESQRAFERLRKEQGK